MRNPRKIVAGTLALAFATSLAACSSPSTSQTAAATGGEQQTCENTITKTNLPVVKLWAWYPNFAPIVDLYNNAHNDVQVCWVNAGAGKDEYSKFNVALKAGTGAPDVVMLEADQMPSYILAGDLVDISKYGANDVKKNYYAGAWSGASSGDGVYAIPVDSGPMGLYYRQDIFDKYKIAVPTTWAEFADAAAKLKAAGSGATIADFPTNEGGFVTGILAQGGWDPYTFNVASPTDISVRIDSPAATKVVNYWFDLIDKGLVDTTNRGTPDFQTKLVNGGYAVYIAAAWGKKNIVGIPSTDTEAVWRAAPLPQWDINNPAATNWGGSDFAVTKYATDKKLAAQVAEGLLGDMASWKLGVEGSALYPTFKPMLDSDYFSGLAEKFVGDQKMNEEVWLPATRLYKGISYGPVQTFMYDKLHEAMAAAIQKTITPDQILPQVQAEVVKNLKDQGFKVN